MLISKVLIAEDEAPIADVMVGLFRDEGFAVRHAWDGAEAMAMIERDPPDVLVCDVKMPRTDGVQLARRAAARANPVPVVLTSAQISVLDIPGMVFVAKPFDVDVIVSLVLEMLGGKRGQGAAARLGAAHATGDGGEQLLDAKGLAHKGVGLLAEAGAGFGQDLGASGAADDHRQRGGHGVGVEPIEERQPFLQRPAHTQVIDEHVGREGGDLRWRLEGHQPGGHPVALFPKQVDDEAEDGFIVVDNQGVRLGNSGAVVVHVRTIAAGGCRHNGRTRSPKGPSPASPVQRPSSATIPRR